MRFFALAFLFAFGARAQAQASEAYVMQIGSGRTASLTQFASIAQLSQFGTGNAARIEQTGGSYAQVFQTGSGNVLAGFDASGLAVLSAAAFQMDASTLLLSQSGTANQAFVQQASGSYASITQTGTGNSVTLIQQ